MNAKPVSFITALVLVGLSALVNGAEKSSAKSRTSELFEKIKKAGGLKRGMSHAEVMKITGPPDNEDTEQIWLWVAKDPQVIKSWTDYYDKNVPHVAFYLYFRDGKLVHERPSNPVK